MLKYLVSNKTSADFSNLKDTLLKVKSDSKNLKKGEEIKILIDGFVSQFSEFKITNDLLPDVDHLITIEGVDENSGFDGGIKIENMELWKDNIWRIYLPQVEYTRHLYIDGKFAKRPSTPYKKSVKWDATMSEHFEFLDKPDDICEDGYHSGIVTTYTNIADWKNIQDVEMIFDRGWTHKIIPIESVEKIDANKVFIKPNEVAFKGATKATQPDVIKAGSCPNCFQNVFEFLGQPLEWYFDRREKMLYIGFAEDDAPENHDIRLPIAERFFEICGELDKPVRNLKFKNLTFKNTTWLWPQKYGFPEIQAAQMRYPAISEIEEYNYSVLKECNKPIPYEFDYQKVIAAIRVISARNVSFENCIFTMLGTGALMYEYGAQESKITGNEFTEIGSSAISIGDFMVERAHHPEREEEIVRLIEVSNNHIYETGQELFGSVALIAGYVQDVTIDHNYIHHVPYTAVSVGWGWGDSDVSVGPYRPTKWKVPSVCKRNTISNNHIHNAMSVLCDGGSIYTLGCMDGTVISGNHIHESSGYKGIGYNRLAICGYQTEDINDKNIRDFFVHGSPGGIYLDEGSRGIKVSGNLVYDVPLPLYYHNQLDKGYEMVTFENNIINQKPENNSLAKEIAKNAGIMC